MDENLYSRQIAVYGLNVIKNLNNSNVLINGLVFDWYLGLKEYIEIECNSEKILNSTNKKLDVKPDNSYITIDGMFLN